MSETKEIKRPRINDEAFVKVWMKVHLEGGSQSDVAHELGCTPAGVNGKFKRFVKQGVDLPVLSNGRGRKVDVAGLNKLIQSISAG